MGIFIFMYAGLLMTWFISSRLPHKLGVKFAWITGFLILWLIQALRDEYIGTDLKFYVPTFLNGNWSAYSVESGYVALNTTLRSFTDSTQALLAIVSFITLYPVSYIFKRYSENICLSYIIFASLVVYHFTFSGLRQAIAIGIIVLSYIFINKHKLIPFVACVLIATLFHVSSIVFIIFYPLCNWIKMTDKRYFLFIAIGLGIILVLKPILEAIIPMIFGEDKYMVYIEHEAVAAYNLIIVFFAMFLFTFLVESPSRQLQDFRMAIFCTVMCQSLGLISSTAPRIGYYFIPLIALAIPQTIFEMKKGPTVKMMMTSGITAFMIFFFFYAYSAGYLEVIPYKFYWE